MVKTELAMNTQSTDTLQRPADFAGAGISPNTSLRPIARIRRRAAAELLARAFLNYPLVEYLFEGQDARRRAAFADLFEALIESRLVRDWPVLGNWYGNTLAGVAVISAPDDRPSTPEADAMFEEAARAIGKQASERFKAYEKACDAGLPVWPHHYLGILGVDPVFQGLHFGRALLEATQQIAKLHPVSQGVVLNTEAIGNVGYYEDSGFRNVHEERVDSVKTWTMTWQP